MIPANPVILQCLCCLAWCDGLLMDEETAFLRDVFHQLHLDVDEQEALLNYQGPLPKEQELLVACPDSGTRRSFLRLAVDLAWSDGELSDPEWDVIKGFCQTFAMRIRTWQELNSWLS
jgi:tellurite resistance protein